MGKADYLKLGSWNALCDRCGKKFKGDELRKTWDGLFTCAKCWEPRQAQDFVRGVVEHPEPPFVRKPPDVFLGSCGPAGRTSIADVCVAECWIAEFIDPAYDPYQPY